jgi:hypothetical protein
VVTDSIFVAGDIARAPHVLYEYQFMSAEHWDNAVIGARVAAHNMVSLEPDRRPHLLVPQFWSGQFGVNIKGTGVQSFGDEVHRVLSRNAVSPPPMVSEDRIVGAVAFNHGKWLEYYTALIEKSAPFPPPPPGYDVPTDTKPVPAEFPDVRAPTELPTVILTGHDPIDRGAAFEPARRR